MALEGENKRFFEMVLGLDKQIKDRVIDFEDRIYSLYDLKKKIRQIQLTLQNITSTNEKNERELLKEKAIQKISEMQKIIATSFSAFLTQQMQGIASEEELLKKQEELLKGWEVMAFREFEELKNAPFIGKTQEKIEKIMFDLKKSMALEAVDIKWDEHFHEIIELFRDEIIPHMKSLIRKIYENLEELKSRIKFLKPLEKTERIMTMGNDIMIEYHNLDRLVRTEKMRVIKPLYKFLGTKRRELKLIQRHINRKEKITKKDILRDVHTFTDSNETQRYLTSLFKFIKHLDDDAKSLIPHVGNLAAVSGERKAINLEKSAGLSYIDALTKINNRRSFDRDLENWVDLTTIKSVSLIMMDIDNFKDFNETYGHVEGDTVLKIVAKLIKKVVDEKNIYRYGGEEFSVLIKGISNQEMAAIAERIRKTVEDESIPIMAAINQKVAPSPESRIPKITLSLGVANFPLNARDRNDLVVKADSALYRAKKMGKNRVSIYQ